MKSEVYYGLVGAAGGTFCSVYSNAVRHLPAFRGFPGFHLTAVVVGGAFGWFLGGVEQRSLASYEQLLQKYNQRRGVAEASE